MYLRECFQRELIGGRPTSNMYSIIQWDRASERKKKKTKEEERVSWIAKFLSLLLHPLG